MSQWHSDYDSFLLVRENSLSVRNNYYSFSVSDNDKLDSPISVRDNGNSLSVRYDGSSIC